MELHLIRDTFTPDATTGMLRNENGIKMYVLEDTDRKLEQCNGDLDQIASEKVYGKTAIPRGRYEIVVTMSNRFKRLLPLLKDVPGFEGIRIHPGNAPKDTDGCLLPGVARNKDWVSGSVVAFTALFADINRAIEQDEKVFITIS